MLKGVGRQATYVALIALLWIALFEFNETVFAGAQLSLITNLLFLPALLRPLAVLLFGGAGVMGLFLGALVTFPVESLTGLSLVVVAAASSVPAWIAVAIMRRRQRFAAQLSDDLSGLEFNTIVITALLCSALNSGAHYFAFWYVPQTEHSFAQFAGMLVGDTIGCFLMLSLLSIVLRGLKSWAAKEGAEG
jgi:hypothetical protein